MDRLRKYNVSSWKAVGKLEKLCEEAFMNTFICHFDASLKLGRAACAFTITRNGKPFANSSVVTECIKSDMAEATALFFLLAYVESNIKHGSNVIINGDAKGVIDSVNCGNNRRYSVVCSLYQKLIQKYKLKIRYIPREQNSEADALARRAFIIESSREICLRDIKVSKNHILPGPKRYQKLETYYQQTGELLTNIRVSHNNKLISGYGEYIILLNANVEHWVVSA